MPPTPTPLLDCATVSGEILCGLAEREPRLGRLARRHLARLTPDRWTIEWHLAWWLGHRFDLDPGVVAALVRSNVLGLLSIRLEDDLVDGEVAPDEVADTQALARLAYQGAVAEYRARFSGGSPVWPFLDRSMAAWRGARGPELAARGAPIKIAGYACCVLADRLDAWPAIERTLDGALTALVLYDQFLDWEADLAAGRWNAFVASIIEDDQDPAAHDRIHAVVLTSMMTRDVVREHFDTMHREATQAARLATELGLTELAEFLMTWAGRASEQGASITEHYRAAADQATRLFFGTRMEGAAA
jgi:hypothetical protein